MVPTAKGGGSVMPRNLFVNQVDSLVRKISHGADLCSIAWGAEVINVHASEIERKIADELMRSGEFADGRRLLELRVSKDTMAAAAVAHNALMDQGIDIGTAQYKFWSRRQMASSIRSDRGLVDLKAIKRRIAIASYERREKELVRYVIPRHVVVVACLFPFQLFDRNRITDKYASFLVTDYADDDEREHFIKVINRTGRTAVEIIHLDDVRAGRSADVFTMKEDVFEFEKELNSIIPAHEFIPDATRDFDYLDQWMFVLEDEVAMRTNICPLATWDVGLRRRIMTTDVSSKTADDQIKARRLLSTILTGGFPSDLTEDAILQIIKQPAIAFDQRNIIDALVAMGADAGRAGAVAPKIQELIARHDFVENAVHGNITGRILNFMNLDDGEDASKNIIKHYPPSMPREDEKIVRAYAKLYSLVQPFQSPLRHVSVYVHGDRAEEGRKRRIHVRRDWVSDLIHHTTRITYLETDQE
jgi:hypothetical protein